MFKKRAVMRSYSVLTINAYITDAYFHYTEKWLGHIITGAL